MSLPPVSLALAKHPDFRRGSRDVLEFIPGIVAWGLVTGVAMVKGGLSVPLALFMSLVALLGFGATRHLAADRGRRAAVGGVGQRLAASTCVFVLYSAQWRVYFGHLPRFRRVALSYFAADLNLVSFQSAPTRVRGPSPGR